MPDPLPAQVTVFEGNLRIATGAPEAVAAKINSILEKGGHSPVLAFDDGTARQVDIDLRAAGTPKKRSSLWESEPAIEPRTVGRPRLGVIAREVTLLPRHWEWLGTQRGGASAALRRLIDQARKRGSAEEAKRDAREAIYRFMTAIAGNAPGYEEALRGLFAGDVDKFRTSISGWAPDVREYIWRFAPAAFGATMPLFAAEIPFEKRKAVLHATREALSAVEIESVEQIAKGVSGAGVFKIAVSGKPYLLRIDGPPDGVRNNSRHYTCLRIAAEAEISPRVIYANAEEGIAITDFVHADSALKTERKTSCLKPLVDAVKKLHGTQLFPRLVNYLDGVNFLMDRCEATGILSKSCFERVQHFFGPLSVAYPRTESDLVSSHNDLNPGNVLFEGKRVWLVDWEAAFAADRFVDLAAIANFFAVSEAEHELILKRYFGAGLAKSHHARLFLMRQANRLFYAMVTLNFLAGARPDLKLTMDDIKTAKFEKAGEEVGKHSDAETKKRRACALLKDTLRDFESPNYAAAMSLLSDLNASAGAKARSRGGRGKRSKT